jgi:hypothetical protein
VNGEKQQRDFCRRRHRGVNIALHVLALALIVNSKDKVTKKSNETEIIV